MAVGGINKWTLPGKAGGIPRVSTRSSVSVESTHANAGRDGRTCLARPNSQARTGVQLTTSRTGNLIQSIYTMLEMTTIYQVYISTAPYTFCMAHAITYNHYKPIWVGEKKGAYSLAYHDRCKGSTNYMNYLEDYWPCAGGLSAVNAIGTQLRDPINSGLGR